MLNALWKRWAGAALAIGLLGAAPATADTVERPDLADAFAAQGTVGTFVAYDLAADRMTVVNRERAETRYVPASTFKIVNALIALDAGVVKDADEVFPYDGQKRAFPVWEKDLTLKEAMKLSAVPVFQEIARRVGRPTMTARVAELDYGNRDVGMAIDRFWLDGPLAISAVEQARFVARLARGALPASERAVRITRELIRQDDSLFAKTGTALRDRPGVGWWVGWVEQAGTIHAFAINHDLKGPADFDTRKVIARDLLGRLGIL